MGSSRGDEMVAEYLARLEQVAEPALPADERDRLLRRTERRIRDITGEQAERNPTLVAHTLAVLGEPEELVAAVLRGRRVGAPTYLPPDLALVRPRSPVAESHPDVLELLAGIRVELVALVALLLAPSFVGPLGALGAAILVVVARFWNLRAKLVTLLGLPAFGVGASVIYAWLRAAKLDPAPASGDRLADAGRAFADAVAAMPALIGVVAAAYLGYLLFRHLEAD